MESFSEHGYGSRSFADKSSQMDAIESTISPYIETLMDVFKPAESTDTATHYFSTDEIFDAVKQLNPGADIQKDSIYQAMLDHGFIFKPRKGTTGIDFRWLLIQK